MSEPIKRASKRRPAAKSGSAPAEPPATPVPAETARAAATARAKDKAKPPAEKPAPRTRAKAAPPPPPGPVHHIGLDATPISLAPGSGGERSGKYVYCIVQTTES